MVADGFNGMARSWSPIACAAHFVRLSANRRARGPSERSTGSLRRRSKRTRRPAVDDHSWRRRGHRLGDRATVQDASAFASGREFAAFLGLTPRQNSTGANAARAHTVGDRYLRKLLWWAPARRCAIAEATMTPCVYGEAVERKTVKTSSSDRGGARQQGRAHRFRADDEGGQTTTAGRRLNERGYR